MAGQIADLMEVNEALAGRLAGMEHLLSRNSGNSSSPPSRDDGPGRTPPPDKPPRPSGGPRRGKGKQPRAAGANLAFTESPDACEDRFPQGRCECGTDLAEATDLGVADRYQQHEIPQVAVKVTQYDQHQVRCGCGRLHTAARPEGARRGVVGYGPNLQAFAVYLVVVHFVPAHRCVQLLASLTGCLTSSSPASSRRRRDQLDKDYLHNAAIRATHSSGRERTAAGHRYGATAGCHRRPGADARPSTVRRRQGKPVAGQAIGSGLRGVAPSVRDGSRRQGMG